MSFRNSIHRIVLPEHRFAHLAALPAPAGSFRINGIPYTEGVAPPPSNRERAVDLSPPPASTSEQVAELIRQSGAKRRAESDDDLPPKGSAAREIIEAGRKARGEQ